MAVIRNKQLRENLIEELKWELAKKYVYLLSGILFCFAFFFLFIIKSPFMVKYLFSGSFSLILLWIFFKRLIPLHKMVFSYLIFAPLYNVVVMIKYWPLSIVSFVWLVPIPIGAYIFFSKKEIIGFSIYSTLIIVFVAIFAQSFSNYYISISLPIARLCDITVIIANVIIVAHLVHYKNKIANLVIINKLEERERVEMPVSLDNKEMEQYKAIFNKMDNLMFERQLFKDPNLNISMLSTVMSVNNSYISRCIRYQGYDNFNSYINQYRIDFVVKSFEENLLEKHSMLYIYSEAGYKSQSTFNRVFKEIKGITPSEYLQANKNI
jgi:AraC-like DNA-binding protein